MQRTCRESDLDKQYTQYLEISVVQFKLLIELKASLEILETSLLCRKACFLGIEFYLPRLDLHEIEYTITFLLLLKEILLNPQILKLDTDFVYRIITSEHFLSFYSDATFSDRMTFKDLMKSIFSLVLTSTPFNSSFFLAALVFFQQNSPEKELNLLFEDITLDISLFLGVFEVLNCNSNLKIMFPFDIMLRSYSLCKVDRINLTCEDMKKILKFMRNIRREFSIDSNDHTSNSSYKSLAISLLIQLKKVVLTAELILSNIAIFCEIYYYVHLSFPTSSFDFTLAFLYQGDAAGLPILLFCLEDTHFMEESSIYIDWFLCNIFSNNMTNVSDEEFHSFPDSGYERKFLKFIDLSLRAYFRLLFDQSILENPPFFREYIIAGKAKFFEKIYVRNLRLSFLERLFWSHSLESYCESVKIYVPDEISNFENYFYDLIFEQSADATSGNGSTKTGSGSVLEGKDFLFIASLLKYIPFTLPLHFRFELFRRLWERHNSKVGFGRSLYDYLAGPDSMTLNIRRGHEYEDAFQVFLDNKSFYQSKDFRIVFTDELGMREAGMDGGGLFREFLFEIFRTVFSPVFGLFITMEDASESWYPNPNSFLTTGVSLAYYEFLGTLVGCAIFVKALLPINFADTFIKRIYNISPQFDELKSFDPQLYKNLLMLKKYTSDISELGLNFSIVDEGKVSYCLLFLIIFRCLWSIYEKFDFWW